MVVWEMSDPTFEADILNEKLKVAPWEGHRKFAYDLIRYIRPSIVVELGSHYGCSLFSFAQAIKDERLKTLLYAVDTWQGDEQAGFYGEEVFDLVKKTCEMFFQSINILLLRKTFDEALQDIEDNSVDIIHIDGLHTYDAVSHDYNTWLPKLKKNGVILFHDVYSPVGYGSNDFWKEISEQFPNFSLKHSWGLGILFPKGDELYKKLLYENIPEKLLIYEYKARYELETIKNHDLTHMVVERDKAIRSNEKMIQERDSLIADQYKIIDDLKKTIASLEVMIKEHDNEYLAQINGKDKVIEELVSDRDRITVEFSRQIEDISNLLNVKKKEYNDLKELNNTLHDRIDELTKKIEKLEETINYYQAKRLIVNFRRKK
ncbi:hypothetical protein Theco_3913 [Thermobacillus composti KWC4]|uniref:O-methyltransferase n=1 Tax=Thermobacillus composti (strain DSM 18247 / JCM 13945 / KWC4) TaxID=717605 RepID=L0EK80_THECK|nr:hypothetical protein Theco_3913 [Thermobacillus composti KWC4]